MGARSEIAQLHLPNCFVSGMPARGFMFDDLRGQAETESVVGLVSK